MKCLDDFSVNKKQGVQSEPWEVSDAVVVVLDRQCHRTVCVRACVRALAAITAHVKKSFTEPLNVNVFPFPNILSSASVRTNSAAALDFTVSRRANSGSSPTPWAQLRP